MGDVLEFVGSFGEGGSEYTLLDYSVFRRVIGANSLHHVNTSIGSDYYETEKENLLNMWEHTLFVLRKGGFPFESIVVTTPLQGDSVSWVGNTCVIKGDTKW